MCKALGELGQAITAYAAGFDVDALPPADLAAALEAAGQVEKVAATLASLIAARLARAGPSAGAGRQAERALARSSGTSLSEARRAIEAGQALAAQPEVRAAAQAGALSRAQAALVADAVAANPGAAPALVDKAGQLGLSELAEECARAKAATVGLEAQRRAVHAARSLRSYTNSAGAWHLHALGRPADGAQVMAVLGELATGIFDQARRDGRRERPEAYLYDALLALVAMATGRGGAPSSGPAAPSTTPPEAGGGGPGTGPLGPPGTAPATATGTATVPAKARLGRLRPSFLVRADLGALLRGYPVDGEVCEIAGYGPISTEAALDLVDTLDPFLTAIVTDGQKVLGVAHLGRRPNAYQRSALDWLYPTCGAEGCPTRAGRLQSDHRADWAETHFTVLDLLDRLCPLHHGLKTRSNWALVEGRGKRPFVPPDDPRHPRHGHRHRREPDDAGAGAGARTGAGPPPDS